MFQFVDDYVPNLAQESHGKATYDEVRFVSVYECLQDCCAKVQLLLALIIKSRRKVFCFILYLEDATQDMYTLRVNFESTTQGSRDHIGRRIFSGRDAQVWDGSVYVFRLRA